MDYLRLLYNNGRNCQFMVFVIRQEVGGSREEKLGICDSHFVNHFLKMK